MTGKQLNLKVTSKQIKVDGNLINLKFQFSNPESRSQSLALGHAALSSVRYDLDQKTVTDEILPLFQVFNDKNKKELRKLSSTNEKKTLENVDIVNFLKNLRDDVSFGLLADLQEKLYLNHPLSRNMLFRRIWIVVPFDRVWIEAFIVNVVEFNSYDKWTVAYHQGEDIITEEYIPYAGMYLFF